VPLWNVHAETATLQEMTSCPVLGIKQNSHAKKIKEHTLENGLDAQIFDVNSDGKPDFVTYRFPFSGITDLPIFYEVDVDGDNIPDRLYIDILRDGSCDALLLYQDYTVPGHLQGPDELPLWLADAANDLADLLAKGLHID
jgi:hypothetical protein